MSDPVAELGPPPTFRRAALTSAGLCGLFLIVYGVCNRFTATRSDVGVWVFDWERHIPFVPLLIVPYLSIDLFFVAAPFLCRDRRELRVLAWRITLAIAVAAVFFLAMPLRFSFERPATSGVVGAVFEWFRAMDLPFNQFPSLHIALRTILGDTYARRLGGWPRVVVNVWFSLISLSTVLVYQHHVVDVLGGFALAAVCFYVVRVTPWKRAVVRNRRIGAYYAAGALVLATLSFTARPRSLWLLWPVISLATVAAAYLGLGADVYRKADGRLPASARLLLLWPLLGQWLSWKHYARKSRRWDVIHDRLWLGRALTAREADEAIAGGVKAVLDVTGEFSACAPFRGAKYLNVPILDLTPPTREQIERAVAFIAEHTQHGIVYVHCKAGYSRSAVVTAAHLLHSGAAENAEAAIERIRVARAGIVIRPEAEAAIRAYAVSLSERN